MAILSRIEDACEELLALVFENYYSLCEKAQSGILDGGVAAPDSPAPVLKPAVNLSRALHCLCGWHQQSDCSFQATSIGSALPVCG